MTADFSMLFSISIHQSSQTVKSTAKHNPVQNSAIVITCPPPQKSSPITSIGIDREVHSKMASPSGRYQDEDNHQEYLCWINVVGGVMLTLFCSKLYD